MVSLLWWIVILAAAVQAGRAWGAPSAIGAALLLLLLSWFPFGTLLSLGGAVAVGYQAENSLQRRLTG